MNNLFNEYDKQQEAANTDSKSGAIMMYRPTKDVKNYFPYFYNKDSIMDFVHPLVRIIKKAGWTSLPEDRSYFRQMLGPLLTNISNVRKDNLLDFAHYILSSPEVRNQLIDHFPAPVKDAMRYVAINKIVRYDELPKEASLCYLLDKKSYYTRWRQNPYYEEYWEFIPDMSNVAYLNTQCVTMLSHYKFALDLVVLEYLNKNSLTPLTEPIGSKFFNCIDVLPLEMKHLAWMMHNGDAISDPDNASGFKMTTVNKFQKTASVLEFFPDDSSTTLRRLRSRMILETFSRAGTDALEKDFESKYIDIINKIINTGIFSQLVITNMQARHANNLSPIGYAVDIVVKILKELYNGWYSADDLCEFVLCSTDMRNNVNRVYWDVANMRSPKNTFTDQMIEISQITRDVVCSTVRGVLLWLAAIGIIEIGYDDVNTDMHSLTECVKSFRVTELGKLVGKHPSNYKRASTYTGGLYLDENKLIVRADNDNVLGLSLIKEVATPISINRYKVTYQSFLSKCSGGLDITTIIDNFKGLFEESQITPVWQKFFDELLAKANPFERIAPDKYTIFKLRQADRNLMNLLATDPKLSEIVVRGTGLTILVLTKKMETFKKILAREGYSL